MTRPGLAEPVRQWQVAFSRGGTQYIITCSALASEFDNFEPEFAAAISSFRVDIGLVGRWLQTPKWVRRGVGIAILAALVSAILAGGRRLWKRTARGQSETPRGENLSS